MAVSRSSAEPGSASRGEGGFTLIEMLVALAIFSLAALAILRLGGATATNSARLTEQALAEITARNLAVELQSDPAAPPFGTQGGVIQNASRQWRWTRIVARSPEARIQLITIRVQQVNGPGVATLSVFKNTI